MLLIPGYEKVGSSVKLVDKDHLQHVIPAKAGIQGAAGE
jgi:hypothetical protein